MKAALLALALTLALAAPALAASKPPRNGVVTAAAEPLSLLAVGAGLLGAALIRRKR